MVTGSSSEDLLRNHIDRLRGLFAAFVLLGHSIDLANGVGTADRFFPLVMTLRPYLGFVWVVGFIVLSGFCVARSCERATRQTGWGYASLRATRLLPVLWASLFIAAVVENTVANSPHRPQIWSSGIDTSTFLVNVVGLGAFWGQYGSLAPAYTLSYEIVFYVLWGVAWFGVGRRKGAALGTALLISLVLYAGHNLLPVALQVVFSEFVLLLFVCWCSGAACSLWLPQITASPLIRRISVIRWIAVAAVTWVGFEFAQMPLLKSSPAALVYYPLLATGFLLVTVGFVRKRVSRTAWFDQRLGEISYPLFLSHGPVIMGLASIYRAVGLSLPFVGYVLALCVPALIVAFGLMLLVDRPVMALRSRVRNRLAVPASVPGAEANVAV